MGYDIIENVGVYHPHTLHCLPSHKRVVHLLSSLHVSNYIRFALVNRVDTSALIYIVLSCDLFRTDSLVVSTSVSHVTGSGFNSRHEQKV